ncbi:dihydrofolate reductase family protein [Anaeromyxobacter oryzae]|uniref:Deaminase reductase n=1 Tax=Anaeromyxobacter oryzae TaxID=2918170 RepID=A0ABM7WZQ5_9BACT|nr:dihydrofolate reductase family protein [Anaeromyxobacter oryzae]BDG05023.1 deaminase reductase [Anaeromyxobacter oryzae]
MRKIIVTEWMSLDGVVQAPAYANEDPSGGFKHGGWHLPYFEPVAMKWVAQTLEGAGGYLFGRRTYETFAAYWPGAPKDEEVLSRPLNERPKYVASRTLKGELPWNNARVIEGSLAALKDGDGGDLLCIGSSALVQALFALDLVDELRLIVDPVLLGGGKRAFRDDGVRRPFRLVEGQLTSTGALLATYARA